MIPRLLADLVLVAHLGFIAFAVLGGLLGRRFRWLALVHLPCVAWGAWIEWTGGVCPLTPLENRLRRSAGEGGYTGGFIERYVVPVVYPAEISGEIQIVLAVALVLVNVAVYARRRW